MATVQWLIMKHHKKEDGTYNPKIQIIHNRTTAYIATGIYTECVKFRKGMSIGTVTDPAIEDSLNDKVKKIRAILNAGEDVISEIDTAKMVKEYILRIMDTGNEIDFLKFAKEYTSSITNTSTIAYNVTRINALSDYVIEKTGVNVLPISRISYKFLKSYEEWLSVTNRKSKKANKEKSGLSPNSINSYMGAISILFNAAKKKYNDYEADLTTFSLIILFLIIHGLPIGRSNNVSLADILFLSFAVSIFINYVCELFLFAPLVMTVV